MHGLCQSAIIIIGDKFIGKLLNQIDHIQGYHERRSSVSEILRNGHHFGGFLEFPHRLFIYSTGIWSLLSDWSYSNEVTATESVEFEEGTIGIALNLKSNDVDVVWMSDSFTVQEESWDKCRKKYLKPANVVPFIFHKSRQPSINPVWYGLIGYHMTGLVDFGQF